MGEMTKKPTVPAIRFKGFTDTWEQCELGAIIQAVQELTSDFENYPLYSLTIENGVTPKTERYERSFLITKETDLFKIVPEQCFVSNPMNLRFGAIGFNDSGKKVSVSGYYDVFSIDRGECSNFWCVYLKTANSLKRFDDVAIGSLIEKRRVHFSQLTEMSFPAPNMNEKKKLGEFFERLERLITLHQRKLDKLHKVKRSLLERMFPRNGANVPEIRFSGFTDAWEQRKLGDIGKARSGVGFPDADQGGVTGVPFFKVSDMNLDGNENEMTVANNYVTAEQIADHRWSPITELPAIFFAKVGTAVMLNRKRLCRFPFLLDNNTMAYSLSPTKWDADFAKALFGTIDLTSLVQVGALPSYNAGDVESMEIYLPSLLEQEQIGAYFKQLDHLITLHQRKSKIGKMPLK